MALRGERHQRSAGASAIELGGKSAVYIGCDRGCGVATPARSFDVRLVGIAQLPRWLQVGGPGACSRAVAAGWELTRRSGVPLNSRSSGGDRPYHPTAA